MDYGDKEKVCSMLTYWIGHNKEHGQEIMEWAEKTRMLGENEACELMLKAVQEMGKADELLAQALERLK